MKSNHTRQKINGILLLDKSPSISSNGALQRVKRLFNAKKAGHTGSLDPLATGMLPICFGEATKFSQFLLDADKAYTVTGKLGMTTTTGDREGEVVATACTNHITHEKVANALTQFIGEIEQIPPMYSALKFQGQPLYKLARQGVEIERKPRRITIFDLQLESVTQDEFTIHVRCSKGTYVRTLVEDIGKVLNCGAHVQALRRTAVSPYHDRPMYTLDALEAMLAHHDLATLHHHLLPIETAVNAYPALKLSTASTFYLRMGQPVRYADTCTSPFVRLFAEDGQFLGVGSLLPDGRVKPERLINTN